MEKRVLVEIEELLWAKCRMRALEEKRPVKGLLENALRLYLSGVAGVPVVEQAPVAPKVAEPPRTKLDELRAKVAEVGGTVLTAKQLAARRERQRGNFEESQDPRDLTPEGEENF